MTNEEIDLVVEFIEILSNSKSVTSLFCNVAQ